MKIKVLSKFICQLVAIKWHYKVDLSSILVDADKLLYGLPDEVFDKVHDVQSTTEYLIYGPRCEGRLVLYEIGQWQVPSFFVEEVIKE